MTGSKMKEALCPFYSLDDWKRIIVCEGMVKDSTVSHRFKNKVQLEKHLNNFCCQDYKKCPWFKTVVEAKYKGWDD